MVVIDRDAAARFGVTAQQIDDALYSAFGQRLVSTILTQLNQYHVVMEVRPEYQQNPVALKDIYVPTTTGSPAPLTTMAHLDQVSAPLSINHQGQFPAVTLSFNLAPGVALGQAVRAIESAAAKIGAAAGLRGRHSRAPRRLSSPRSRMRGG